MYRIFTLSIFCLLFTIFSLLIAVQPGWAEDKQPLLFIDKDHVNAGTVVEGFSIRHTFLIQNRGDAPLIINDAKTDCSCTKIAHDDIIKPDHNTYLRVNFHTLGQLGNQVKTIRINSNDPVRPSIILKIYAHVLPAVKVEPKRVFFKGFAGKAITEEVVITASDNRNFELTVTKEQLDPQTKVTIKKMPKTNAYTLVFTNQASANGTTRGRLFLKTDIPHRSIIVIPVLSRINEPLRLFPKNIDFGRQELNFYHQTTTPHPVRTVNLSSEDGTAPKIQSLEIDSRIFKTSISYLTEIGITRIQVTALIRKFNAASFDDYLVVRLKSGKNFSVPVRVDVY